MDVLNMNPTQVSVLCRTADGGIDYVTVQAKRRVTLPEGLVVDTNWQALEPNIRTFASADATTAIQLRSNIQVPVPVIPPPAQAPAPSPSPANTKE